METSAEQIIDANIKTINTKENSDDMLYPVVNKLKMITNAAIPMPLKNAFHKWLTLFYSNLSFLYSRYVRRMSNKMAIYIIFQTKRTKIDSRPLVY
ncbi:hypothetical protein PGRAN_10713 [Listeria grandensis FSL F6-0971]|uniref:Uncharacterized protein n=1 Tax=Listeria grandensis FSL F6-0971 TaxID=1265819 RepID=W7BA81_9LIST|nr:hypothetical protein PGRAN_10713 [Listeria grandensis FSL F6-0971]